MTPAPHSGRAVPSPPSGWRESVPVLLTVAAVAAFSFASGGYIFVRTAPVVLAWAALTAAGLTAGGGWRRPPALLLAGVVAFAAYTAWCCLSLTWSIAPDLSWRAADQNAFYLAVAAVLAAVPVGRRQVELAALGSLAVLAAVAGYAFLGKALPEIVAHAHTYARLDAPVGYWNVLALMTLAGLCLALAVAARRTTPPWWRGLAAAAGVLFALTFFFTFSRGGWVALGVALVAYFVLTHNRLASVASLVVIALPAALVLWGLRDRATLFAATTDDALRTAEGHDLLRWTVVALIAAALAQAAVALAHRALPWPRWLRVAAGAAIVAVLVGGAVVVGGRELAARGGSAWVKDRLHALLTDSDRQGAGDAVTRLASLRTGRPPLWREALEQSRYARLAGTGAGSFPLTHYRFRTQYGGIVKHSHSQWLNVLSELGAVGLALYASALLLLLAAALRTVLRRRRDPLLPLLAAMAAAVVAFGVHMTWDWDWDMAAVTTLMLLFAVTVAGYGAGSRSAEDAAGDPVGDREATERDGAPSGGDGAGASRRPSRRRWGLRVTAAAALAALAVAWLPPYLSERAEAAAVDAAGEDRLFIALEQSRRAARCDPLAVDPLIVQALVLQRLGRNREAREVLVRATRLQPDNHEVWYQLGLLELDAFGRRARAAAALRRCLGLNPGNTAARYELERLLAE